MPWATPGPIKLKLFQTVWVGGSWWNSGSCFVGGCQLGGRWGIKLLLPLFRDTEGALCPHNGTERSVCVLCACLCGRGCACSHTQADWPRPHLAVESAGAGSHASLKHTTVALESLFALIGWSSDDVIFTALCGRAQMCPILSTLQQVTCQKNI